jgi:hypothetical protein
MTRWRFAGICAVTGVLVATFAWAQGEMKVKPVPTDLLGRCLGPPLCANLAKTTTKAGAAITGVGETKGMGVYGQARGTYPGVRGVSLDKGPGVLGESELSNGVKGVSGSSTDSGVYGVNLLGGSGVAGSTTGKPSGAGGVFSHLGGGDHIRAGVDPANPAFQVKSNGDVFVRGALIGQTGPAGPAGPAGANGATGPQGPSGPGIAVGICHKASCVGVCMGGATLTSSAPSPCQITFSSGAPGCSYAGDVGQANCCVCYK